MSLHHLRLDNRRWRALRRAVIERDGHRCRACGRAGKLECDHIVALHHGGAVYDPANLQTVCRACHIAKTAAENRRPPTAAESAWRELVRAML